MGFIYIHFNWILNLTGILNIENDAPLTYYVLLCYHL